MVRDSRDHLRLVITKPLEGGGGELPYMGYIGMCPVKGMVFKQFTLG